MFGATEEVDAFLEEGAVVSTRFSSRSGDFVETEVLFTGDS